MTSSDCALRCALWNGNRHVPAVGLPGQVLAPNRRRDRHRDTEEVFSDILEFLWDAGSASGYRQDFGSIDAR